MKKYLAFALAATFMLTSGFICTGNNLRQVKNANADLSAALNKATNTVIELTQQQLMTREEQADILPRIGTASTLSRRIEDCTNLAQTNLIQGCVEPLLSSIKVDIDSASLGVKSAGAKATMTSVLNVVLAAIQSISDQRIR